MCYKFEGGNGSWICDFLRKVSRLIHQKLNLISICKFFSRFLWVFTSFFEASSCFDFCKKNIVKENMNLWQISLFFVRRNAPLRVTYWPRKKFFDYFFNFLCTSSTLSFFFWALHSLHTKLRQRSCARMTNSRKS